MKRARDLISCRKITILILSISVLLVAGIGWPLYGYHGKEVVVALGNAHFSSLSGNQSHQIKVMANYSVFNSSMVGQKINAVMKVYSSNGALLKTSSFRDGFILNKTGSQRFVTNIPGAMQNIMAVITFTNLEKTLVLSPLLKIPLNLGQSINGR